MDENVQKTATNLTAIALATLPAAFVMTAVSWKSFDSSLKRLTNTEPKLHLKKILWANLTLLAVYAGYTVARIFWPDKIPETGILAALILVLAIGVLKGAEWLIRWVIERSGYPARPMQKFDPNTQALLHLHSLFLVILSIFFVIISLGFLIGFATDLESTRDQTDFFRWAQ